MHGFSFLMLPGPFCKMVEKPKQKFRIFHQIKCIGFSRNSIFFVGVCMNTYIFGLWSICLLLCKFTTIGTEVSIKDKQNCKQKSS